MPRRKTPDIKSLYYLTHVENLPSILTHGILSHKLMEERAVSYTPIYDVSIVGNRQTKLAPNGQSLWDFANLYFQPRNPMLYRVVHEKSEKEIAVVAVHRHIMETSGVFLTDGNAASATTDFFPYKEGLRAISTIWDTITSEWWNSVDGSKRKIMAECLVPGFIPPDMVHTVYVATHSIAQKVREIIRPRELPFAPESTMFFRPTKQHRITDYLSLAGGDMFFSNMQTLTVSVNTVGIMGKGLASRTKYQFPDVYVIYQDACRQKTLRMGKPFLYKREASFDEELADEPSSVLTPNGVKWFLLFATKRHWRNDSDLAGIEEGLRWVVANYEAEGIKSIALPALGCGLGNLDWRDVGPVMCSQLAQLTIPVTIYLPREEQTPVEFLSPEHLLAKKTG
jgi:O-acetyl-ADP-ribose deacetylase (regulator of RNase III)